MAEFWPTSDDAYAAPMNNIPKVVFSKTLVRAEWPDSRIVRGDLAEEIAALKRETEKNMMAWGGAAFAQSLCRLWLVDEYRLILQPGALGEGLPLFKGLAAPLQLKLVDAQSYNTGTVLHVYRPAALPATMRPSVSFYIAVNMVMEAVLAPLVGASPWRCVTERYENYQQLSLGQCCVTYAVLLGTTPQYSPVTPTRLF
jgi:dihydrofolate reductase